MDKKNMFKINLFRQQFKKDRKNVMALMIGMSSVIGDRMLTEEEVDAFFLDYGSDDKMKGADYVAIAIKVAKAICRASKTICPYIEVLP